MREVNQREAARRIRAAMAYKDLSRTAAAKAMNTSPGNLDRFTNKKGKETATPTWDQLWNLAEACDLSPDWFAADLARLYEIVQPGMPVFARPDAAARGVEPRGRLGQILAADAPSPQRLPEGEKDQDKDAQRDTGEG